MWALLSGVFLGWSLGANDAANVFGPAVSSNILSFKKATLLASVFIVLGAMLGGHAGLETVGKLTDHTQIQAFLCMFAAGSVVAFMTIIKLPVSTSQAVIGSIIGAGLVGNGVDFGSLTKVVVCWVGTPIGAALISYILYLVSSRILKKLKPGFLMMDSIIRWGLIICCIYGAYALGANNVANTTGVFVKAEIITPFWALLIGSLSIAFGVMTFSKNVIRTVGKSVVPLDSFSALITLLSSAITVHFYAIVGVPVSSSQAVIGAVLGIGVTKGLYVVNTKTLARICSGWIMTPILSILFSMLLISIVTKL